MVDDKRVNAEDLEINEIEREKQWQKIDPEKFGTSEFWHEVWVFVMLYVEWFALYYDIHETIPPKKEEDDVVVGLRLKDIKISEAPPQEPQQGYFAQFADSVRKREEEGTETKDADSISLFEDDADFSDYESESVMSAEEFDEKFEKDFEDFDNDNVAKISGDEKDAEDKAMAA